MKAICFGMILKNLESSLPADSSPGNNFILLPQPTLSEAIDTCSVTPVLCVIRRALGGHRRSCVELDCRSTCHDNLPWMNAR